MAYKDIQKKRKHDREYMKKWRNRDKDKHNAYMREWYKKNPEKTKANAKRSYEKNRDKIMERQKAYWWRTREERLRVHREWYQNNKEKHKAANKRWFYSLNGRYSRYIKGARERNRVFNLTKEQFDEITKKVCHYCNNSEKIGIDRVNNDNGYVIENCIPCCKECNFLKGTRTYSEFTELCIRIADNLKR